MGSPSSPNFWTQYRIVYTWFADAFTTRTSVLGPVTVNQFFDSGHAFQWATTQAPLTQTPTQIGLIGFLFFRGEDDNGVALGSDCVEFTNLNLGGIPVDCTELPSFDGTGGWSHQSVGSVNVVASGAATHTAYPYQFKYDLDVTKFDASTTTQAHLFDNFETLPDLHPDGTHLQPFSPFLVCPVTRTYSVPITNWQTHKKQFSGSAFFDITPGWAMTQDPPLDGRDLAVPIWGNPGLTAPSTGGATYKPITTNFKPSISVEFPDGARVSHWTVNDPSYGSVSETGASTTFHVTDPRAVFTRTLASNWRLNTTDHSRHGSDAYEVTKHNFFSADPLEDVWAWDGYGWLQVSGLQGGSDAVGNFQISGVWLEVNDPHLTDGSGYSQTEHAFTLSYALPVTSASAASPMIDLLFPPAGLTQAPGPIYPSRIDTLEVSELPTGDTTFTDIALITREHGYLKNDYGVPVQRNDYSALHASQDGAFQFGNWPDELIKPDEIGGHPPYGGAARAFAILTGATSGIIQDSQYALSEWTAHLNRMEGWSWSYDLAAFNAANQDIYGNALQNELADWMRPIAPHMRYTPGTSFQPLSAPMVRHYDLVNAFDSFVIYARFPIWGALEALVDDNGGRAAAGVSVSAIREDTNAVVVTAVTDPSGYVTLSPLPANGVLRYHAQADGGDPSVGIALRPHDRVRIVAHPGARNPYNLEDDAGKYYRADVIGGTVRVMFAEGVIPKFATSFMLAGGGKDDEPVIADDFRRRIYCLFQRDPGTGTGGVGPPFDLYQATSDTQAADFSVPALLVSGAWHPAVARHPESGVFLRAWRMADGSVQGLVNHPGDDPGAFSPITFTGIHLDDDCFSIAAGFNFDDRWWLLGIVGGQPTLYWSSDDCRTWTFHSNLLTGGAHPRLAVREWDGMLVAATRMPDKSLMLTTLGIGENSPGSGGAPATAVVDGSGVLRLVDGFFGLSAAHEFSDRWVLAAGPDGMTAPKEFWSTAEFGSSAWTFEQVAP